MDNDQVTLIGASQAGRRGRDSQRLAVKPSHLASVTGVLLTLGVWYMHRIRGIRRDWCLLVLLIVAVGGCVSAPVQEMSDARQAVAAAEAANAPVEARDAYIKATAHMRYAESALQIGDYKDAREHATWAKAHALVARERALARQSHKNQ